MRQNRTGGFTLIELLIVIAIIGILAAVLIPNLLGARQAAANRAAQTHGRNVYTAVTAYLAENVNATADDITETDCAPETGAFPVPGYPVQAPGSSVASCTYTPTANTTNFTIEVKSSAGQTYNFP